MRALHVLQPLAQEIVMCLAKQNILGKMLKSCMNHNHKKQNILKKYVDVVFIK